MPCQAALSYHEKMKQTPPISTRTKIIVVALTGASGMPYASHLLKYFAGRDDIQVHCIISNAAHRVLELESSIHLEKMEKDIYQVYTEKDIAAPPASGSWRHDGMVVLPLFHEQLGGHCAWAGFQPHSQGSGRLS